jgi:hypothetical protein
MFSYSAFHIFEQPAEEDLYVLQHESLLKSNAQASKVGIRLHKPPGADVFPHSSQLLEQNIGGQFSALNAQFAKPLNRDIFAYSALNLFSKPLNEELFARQDKALIDTGPLPNLRYLQSLSGYP